MGKTRFRKSEVVGKGFGVINSSGTETKVAGDDGTLYVKGTEVTATAAELNVLDVSEVGAGLRVAKVNITAPADDAETKTGWSLPANAVVVDVFLNVTTAEVTGTTETIDVGTDSSDGGDADGYLVGVAVDTTGLVKGTLVNSGQTKGDLLRVDEGGASDFVPEIDIASGGKEITFTAASDNFDELVADIFILYIEVA